MESSSVLRQAKRDKDLPPLISLIRKDFIIDEIQIRQATRYGADAILLIAAILDVSAPVNITAHDGYRKVARCG